ncbi:glycine-rich cell wall structural protein 1.0-like [Iris pallida]|uniref:Glycine-rich cell wall structural protein 1.0-like n=1 Tax=Iris pallida TaxID=29817 RepID=A0AAX6GRY9_IRIPA|nr:glycine-rich cell wall structural protein 1.0-like [Iris pallida]
MRGARRGWTLEIERVAVLAWRRPALEAHLGWRQGPTGSLSTAWFSREGGGEVLDHRRGSASQFDGKGRRKWREHDQVTAAPGLGFWLLVFFRVSGLLLDTEMGMTSMVDLERVRD